MLREEIVVVAPHQRRPVLALETPDGEMALGHALKMVHENHIDRRAANRAEHWQRACGKSFRSDYSESRHDLGYQKFPQIGTVVIEDEVEIGAHSCVDRAALGRTRIGRGTKLDNMVHVGHNCDIGERVVIAAQTGISGSVVIEDDAVIGGQVGFGDHTRVQSGAIIGSKAGILPGKIVRPGVWWGIPVQPLDQYKRMNAHLNRLPQMREELKRLEAEIEEIKKKI